MKVNISFHVVNYRNPVLQSQCVTFTVSLCLSVFIDTLKVKKPGLKLVLFLVTVKFDQV